jgi:hypothetical protein
MGLALPQLLIEKRNRFHPTIIYICWLVVGAMVGAGILNLFKKSRLGAALGAVVAFFLLHEILAAGIDPFKLVRIFPAEWFFDH